MSKAQMKSRLARITAWMNNPIISMRMSDARAEQISAEYFDLKDQLNQLKQAA